MIRRAFSLLEVLIAMVLLSTVSGLAYYNISKAHKNYISTKALEEAKSLFKRTKTLSYILNNEVNLSIDPSTKHMTMRITGLPKGTTLHQHFETTISFPPIVHDIYFEEDSSRTDDLKIVPSYNFAEVNLKLLLNIDGVMHTTSLFDSESTITHLPLPDEVHQFKSLKNS